MSGLFTGIQGYIDSLDVDKITEERKLVLEPLIQEIRKGLEENRASINFICTHNSRRSHFAQIWAQTLAHYFGLESVKCFSGGTEAKALYPMVLDTLKEVGFQITSLSEGENPVQGIKFNENTPAIIGFSKKMDHPINPKSNFIAVMTCDEADEGCPYVPGATFRIPVTYEDPKHFDGTAKQKEAYRERCLQIATEFYYVFSKLKL